MPISVELGGGIFEDITVVEALWNTNTGYLLGWEMEVIAFSSICWIVLGISGVVALLGEAKQLAKSSLRVCVCVRTTIKLTSTRLMGRCFWCTQCLVCYALCGTDSTVVSTAAAVGNELSACVWASTLVAIEHTYRGRLATTKHSYFLWRLSCYNHDYMPNAVLLPYYASFCCTAVPPVSSACCSSDPCAGAAVQASITT